MTDEPRPDPAEGHQIGRSPGGPEASSGSAAAAGAEPWLMRLLVPVHDSRSWLKFLGVICIISGGITALTIVGLLFAWLYIWVGVLLWQAGDRAGQAMLIRDPLLVEQYLQKIKTVIVITGVVVAIGVVASVLSIGMVLTFGWMAAFMEMVPF
jgi:hypothetical protein